MDKPLSKTEFADLCAQIKTLLTIEEVLRYYIKIKKKGKYYTCCCPFHKERTPSFFINSSLGFFKCFGCGAAGDIFSFVEKYENISFLETVALFSERYHIVSSLCRSLLAQKNGDVEDFGKKKNSCSVLKKVQGFFVSSLLKGDTSEALSFLQKRGIDKEKAVRFGVGFCNSSSSFFLNHDFSREENDLMVELGLIHKEEGRRKAVPFEKRISFPFFDPLGNVVGFSWRCLSEKEDGKKYIPKYVNSSESFLFKKREVLFGFLQARGKMKEERKCFLVEGFFDAIAMSCAGYENTVSLSGTALSREQCSFLKKYVDCVSLFFDNDKAGEMATIRAIEQCLKEGFMVNVVRIKTEEKDPDEFLRGKNHEEAMKEIKTLEEDFVSFLYRFFGGENEGLQSKTQAINKLKSFLALIRDSVYKNLAIKKLSSLCGVAVPALQKGCFLCAGEKGEREKKSTLEKYEEEVLFLVFKILFSWKEENAGEFERMRETIGEGSFLSDEKRRILFLFLNTFKREGKIEAGVLNEITDKSLKERIINLFFECRNVEEAEEGDRQIFAAREVGKEDEKFSPSQQRVLYENILFLKIKKIQVAIDEKKEMLKKCAGTETSIILDEIEELKKQEKEFSKNLKINIF